MAHPGRPSVGVGLEGFSEGEIFLRDVAVAGRKPILLDVPLFMSRLSSHRIRQFTLADLGPAASSKKDSRVAFSRAGWLQSHG